MEQSFRETDSFSPNQEMDHRQCKLYVEIFSAILRFSPLQNLKIRDQ
jgi:hypothetical protein